MPPTPPTTVYITDTGQPAGIPPCCPNAPTGCPDETTACGTCLHGCPAPIGQPCCLDQPATA
ncbi:hypothetical protein ACFUYE_00530 [Micromonospora humida]|uniref:hypothetical protein n=1 Tax=Micromonospora humida TaxID=2809018 RepID=UPI00366E753A